MTIATANAAKFATTPEQRIAQRENEIVNTAADRLAKITAAWNRTGIPMPDHFVAVVAEAWARLEQMGPLEPVEVTIPRSFLP